MAAEEAGEGEGEGPLEDLEAASDNMDEQLSARPASKVQGKTNTLRVTSGHTQGGPTPESTAFSPGTTGLHGPVPSGWGQMGFRF